MDLDIGRQRGCETARVRTLKRILIPDFIVFTQGSKERMIAGKLEKEPGRNRGVGMSFWQLGKHFHQ